jgi:sugar phosphate isomerase/epimerase
MKLRVSLLTSFCFNGIHQFASQNSGERWPFSTRDVELYAFMNGDLDVFSPSSARPRPAARSSGRRAEIRPILHANAIRRLALWDRPDEVAANIHRSLAGLRVIGLSTFAADLLAHEEFKLAWESAQKALVFLLQVGRELNQLGHEVRALELVGGSQVDGLWMGGDRYGGKHFVINRLTPALAIERLMRRLQPVCEVALETGIPIALELEVGPLFTVSSLASLQQVSDFIHAQGTDAHRRTLGFNLDIAHWAFLAQISPQDVAGLQSVRERIVHAHISDHSKGHFGDGVVGEFSARGEFEQWLELLSQVGENRSPELPQFSGCVSVEYECAPNVEVVQESVEATSEILRNLDLLAE